MKKRILIVLLIMLTIGFAAVSTTLVINGTAIFGVNSEDFDVYFSYASLDEEDKSDTIISPDGKTITFETKELQNVSDATILEYKVTNSSSQYDANVKINCVGADHESLKVTSNGVSEIIKAKETETGNITIELVKPAFEKNQ